MSIELIVASVAITCALVLYTFGVFGERRSGTLSLRHVLLLSLIHIPSPRDRSVSRMPSSA